MTRLHVTYPDGETAEASYNAGLTEMIELMDPYMEVPGESTEETDPWEPEIGGEE